MERERSPIKRNDTATVHWAPALGCSTRVLNALWLSAPQSVARAASSQREVVVVVVGVAALVCAAD